MGNIKRYFEAEKSYFVTAVTQERRSIFADEKICRILLITIEYFKLILDYKIYAYCIMPNHLHLILHPCGKYELSYIMQLKLSTIVGHL
jgi:REP element-mobilizing transposase RayT